MADLFRWVSGSDRGDLGGKMGRKVVKKWSKFDFFREVGPKTVENFWRPGPVGFGMETTVEREAGTARRGQDGAKIGPFFFFGPKTGQKNCHHPGDPVHSAV